MAHLVISPRKLIWVLKRARSQELVSPCCHLKWDHNSRQDISATSAKSLIRALIKDLDLHQEQSRLGPLWLFVYGIGLHVRTHEVSGCQPPTSQTPDILKWG